MLGMLASTGRPRPVAFGGTKQIVNSGNTTLSDRLMDTLVASLKKLDYIGVKSNPTK